VYYLRNYNESTAGNKYVIIAIKHLREKWGQNAYLLAIVRRLFVRQAIYIYMCKYICIFCFVGMEKAKENIFISFAFK